MRVVSVSTISLSGTTASKHTGHEQVRPSFVVRRSVVLRACCVSEHSQLIRQCQGATPASEHAGHEQVRHRVVQ
jgi:hypothetical protein